MSNTELFNFTDGNPLELSDWTNYLGNFVPLEIIFGAIFLGLGLVVWLKDTTGYMTTTYFLLLGMGGSASSYAVHGSISYVFCMFLAMGIGMALYQLYESRSKFGN